MTDTAAARTLLALVTYDGERYALRALLAHLRAQTAQDFAVLCVDNSADPAYAAELAKLVPAAFPGKSVTVLHQAVRGDWMDKVVASRQAARAYFLAHREYEHLWFVDSDVLVPPEALALLREAHQPIAAGWYVHVHPYRNTHTILAVALKAISPKRAEHVLFPELFSGKTISIVVAGFGCTLLSRDVVAAIPLKRVPGYDTEDVPFFIAAKAQGFVAVLVTPVACAHLKHPEGDPRNRFLDPVFLRSQYEQKPGKMLFVRDYHPGKPKPEAS